MNEFSEQIYQQQLVQGHEGDEPVSQWHHNLQQSNLNHNEDWIPKPEAALAKSYKSRQPKAKKPLELPSCWLFGRVASVRLSSNLRN